MTRACAQLRACQSVIRLSSADLCGTSRSLYSSAQQAPTMTGKRQPAQKRRAALTQTSSLHLPLSPLTTSAMLLLRQLETWFAIWPTDSSAKQKQEDLHWAALPHSECGQILYPLHTGEGDRQLCRQTYWSSADAVGGRALLKWRYQKKGRTSCASILRPLKAQPKASLPGYTSALGIQEEIKTVVRQSPARERIYHYKREYRELPRKPPGSAPTPATRRHLRVNTS